jgi:hypothetical protein
MSKQIFKKYFVSKIINSGETTRSELEFLAKKIGLDIHINWKKDVLDDPTKLQIINIGSPLIGGTHWVAIYAGKYFDPFGLAPAIPGNLSWIPFQIQKINQGHCGIYALLYLYYAFHDEIDKFYNLFNPMV